MKLFAQSETWPLAASFVISRGSRDRAVVVVATLEHDGVQGRGEGAPYPRYNESIEQTLSDLEGAGKRLEQGEPIAAVLASLKGAAANALDCAHWDWRCKAANRSVTDLLGWEQRLQPVLTAYTLSLGPMEVLEKAVRENAHRPILKVKAGRDQVVERLRVVRDGAPRSMIIVDANEAWEPDQLPSLFSALAELEVALIEQPLKAGEDEILATIGRPVPVFADESFHTAEGIGRCVGKYDGVNIKLDKTGGFTNALKALEAARGHGLQVMCGCMLGTSLAMAPAMVVAQRADYVDLDAPLLLAGDRPEGIRYRGSEMLPFTSDLWG